MVGLGYGRNRIIDLEIIESWIQRLLKWKPKPKVKHIVARVRQNRAVLCTCVVYAVLWFHFHKIIVWGSLLQPKVSLFAYISKIPSLRSWAWMVKSDTRDSILWLKVLHQLNRLVNMYNIYETYEFRTKMQSTESSRRKNQLMRKRHHSSPTPTLFSRCHTFKFGFNMADVDGSSMPHVAGAAGGDSNNGPAELAADGRGCARRGPFLIGVAGGTASGKVW